jgi:hypothetical protein
MQITIAWGLIAIFISPTTFYYFTQKTRINREDRREKLKESRQKFLDSLLKPKHNETEKNYITYDNLMIQFARVGSFLKVFDPNRPLHRFIFIRIFITVFYDVGHKARM